ALQYDGGIMVTASHNPPDYNGMKFVREHSKPISADSGLLDIARLIETDALPLKADKPGQVHQVDLNAEYDQHLLSYVDRAKLKPLKVVVNAGNGGAGMVIDRLEPHLPCQCTKIHHEPDGACTHGGPNPRLDATRTTTADA